MKGTDRMPVVEELANRAACREGEALKDTVVLHINHCMENSFYFSELLERLFARAVFIGVPYNDMAVGAGWSFIGYYGRRSRNTYGLWRGEEKLPGEPDTFTGAVEALIEAALREAILPYLKAGKYLLIIEDGGYHYPAAHRFFEEFPEYRAQVLGSVEQTASGTVRGREFMKTHGFAYPCGSISRSDIKMHIESRFIGHRVVEELAYFLYTANTFLDFHHVLLLGYGIVGRQVALDLSCRSCKISVYDTDERIAAAAALDGQEVLKKVTPETFGTDTIVIGNTGADSFEKEMLRVFFEGEAGRLYLASSSSQDKEFKSFLKMTRGKEPWPEGAGLLSVREEEFFSRYTFSFGGREKEVILIAEGLPVNFYRKGGISLTYSVIDLIFAEMLSMALSFWTERNTEKKLWLMGLEEETAPFIPEEELAALWFQEYGLTGYDRLDRGLKGHPESGYLREKTAGEKL